MRPARLVLRSLAFHARAHATTLTGVLAAAAVLTGALALGDSVRASLARALDLRLGGVQAVLGNGERFFGVGLGARLEARARKLQASAAIQLPATAARADGSRRLGDVQLLGVEPSFFAFAPRPGAEAPPPGEAWAGVELARALAVSVGDELVLRVPRPSDTSRELALVSVEEAIRPLRVRVARVLAEEDFGVFSLEAGAGPRANLFVERAWLAERLEVAGRANRLFLAGVDSPVLAPAPAASFYTVVPGDSGSFEFQVDTAGLADSFGVQLPDPFQEAWELDDVGLAWRGNGAIRELVSDQVFLAEPLVEALAGLDPPPLGLLGYFVNAITKGERSTPYSTVAALGDLDARPAPDLGGWRARLGDLGPDEIVLNEWTARDLAAVHGDELTLSYFVLGPGRRLEERTHAFRLKTFLPMEGLGADPSLSPEFPGIGDAENCRDWEPGIPLELERLRDQDEEYWDRWRGAPKAFVSLATARALWGNRFGALTALRFEPGRELQVQERLRTLDPGVLGLPLRRVARTASPTSDFGGLFLGLSCFLIASALLLTALFFAFSVERRAAELGVLRVCGFRAGQVAGLQLGEALLLCALGAALGVALGLGYTRVLLAALERTWQGAVGRTELVFEVAPSTLALSFALSVLLALGAVALVLRRALGARPLALLAGELARDRPGLGRARLRRVALALSACVALACLGGAFAMPGASAGGLAFCAGFAVLLAGLLALGEGLARPARPSSLAALGWTNAARRPARSLTTVALVASAVFLLVVAGANRQGPTPRDAGPDSGTGGFAFLARTSLPVLHDLRTAEGRSFYGLRAEDLAGVELVPLRVRAGDEASCLNLDQPRSPRLLGAPAALLAGRFRFAQTTQPSAEPWQLLEQELGPGLVPAIVDATSLQWTLHKRLGDELELVDGRGRPFRARVVATLGDSILQGDVLLSEARFETLFPDEAGQRAFLIDAPPARAEELATRLARALADEGLTLVPAHERLDLLHGVQNTYLAIFQALGGLGLVLGSAGLLALVLRSAVERRAELALLRALGFSKHELRLLFLGEQGGLVWAGLGLGALAGLFVVLPRLEPGSFEALRTLALLLGAVGFTGTAWVWLGAAPALRGSMLAALNRE